MKSCQIAKLIAENLITYIRVYMLILLFLFICVLFNPFQCFHFVNKNKKKSLKHLIHLKFTLHAVRQLRYKKLPFKHIYAFY